MAPLQVIIFDLYNTLLYISKKNSPYSEIFKLSLSRSATKEFILTRHITNAKDLCKKLSEKGLITNDFDIGLFNEKLQSQLQTVQIYDEVVSTLNKIKQQGYKLGVIANVPTLYLEPFSTYGLDTIINYIVFSCNIGFSKPSEEIYNEMYKLAIRDFRELSNQNMLMVGHDDLNDYTVPKRIGMKARLLKRGSPPSETYIRSLDELIKYV